MKCMVTGAAGFIGSRLAKRLLQEGHSVVGIDSFLDYYPREMKEQNLALLRSSEQFEFIEGSILQLQLSELLKGVDWVFHQAAQAGVRASWGEYFRTYTDNNVLATQRLLEAAREQTQIQKVVYASSSSVYGHAETLPTTEDMTPAPVSPYGVTKLAAEHLMQLYSSEFGVPTVSLRYFTVYGPGQRPDMAFHRFIRAGLEGRTIELYGTGEQSRDFTFIDDIVSANILAAQSKVSGEVFNIGGGSRVTINEMLDFLSTELGELIIERHARQVGDAAHTGADTSKAKSLLGYQPTVDIQSGLRAEIAWLRKLLMERQ